MAFVLFFIFFFKQKTAYEMRISDWSSDCALPICQPVQSSFGFHIIQVVARQDRPLTESEYQSARERVFSDFMAGLREEYGVEVYDSQWEIGRASCRERVCQYV